MLNTHRFSTDGFQFHPRSVEHKADFLYNSLTSATSWLLLQQDCHPCWPGVLKVSTSEKWELYYYSSSKEMTLSAL